MTTSPNPFDALGLPADPTLTDDQVHAAWRAIAAATHPDRPDGGDLPRYTQAPAACAVLNSPRGRSEAYAGHLEGQPARTPPPCPPSPSPPPGIRPLRLLPYRIIRGRTLRMLTRAATAAVLSLAVLSLIPGTAAAPADITGLIVWLAVTARSDLAPPPRH